MNLMKVPYKLFFTLIYLGVMHEAIILLLPNQQSITAPGVSMEIASVSALTLGELSEQVMKKLFSKVVQKNKNWKPVYQRRKV
jgi:hypothetical protein